MFLVFPTQQPFHLLARMGKGKGGKIMESKRAHSDRSEGSSAATPARATKKRKSATNLDGYVENSRKHLNALMALHTGLGDERLKLEQRQKDLEARKLELADKHGGKKTSPQDKLKLNVGGVRMVALRETLTLFPDTRLAALFSGRWESCLLRDKKNRIFLDVNPSCFQKILSYHQLSKVAGPDNPPDLPTVPDDMKCILEKQLSFFCGVRSFPFQSPDDTNGLLHFLGTHKGTQPWKNPHDTGQVACSTTMGGQPRNLVGRSREEAGMCGHAVNKSVTCDLKTVKIKLSSYSFGNTNCHLPSNWKLEGSADGNTFVVLHTATNNRAINMGTTANFVVTTEEFFQFFQLTCTGSSHNSAVRNNTFSSTGGYCFHICNFELYGDVIDLDGTIPQPQKREAPAFDSTFDTWMETGDIDHSLSAVKRTRRGANRPQNRFEKTGPTGESLCWGRSVRQVSYWRRGLRHCRPGC